MPARIFYLDSHVKISEASLSPLTSEKWQTIERVFTKSQYVALSSVFIETLPTAVKALDKLRLNIVAPRPGRSAKGTRSGFEFKDFEHLEEGPKPKIKLNIGKARLMLPPESLKRNAKITFQIEYVPKPLPRTK